jgi:glycosyltransferase involved in cell wall biosynthesis
MKTVLHVLPHPGGGGETYVDALEAMGEYRFQRIFLAPTPSPAAAIRALPRTFWSVFRFADVVHAHGEVASGICLPALAARPSVVTLHGLHLLRRSRGAKRYAAVTNLRLVVRAANRTICVSAAERDEASEIVGGHPAGRLVVIHNGVELPPLPAAEVRDTTRAELGVDASELAGVYIGSLDPHKEALTAARAAVQARNAGMPVVLLVAGDGPQRAELESLAAESEAIRLLGYRGDTERVLAAGDFFVLPSLREGLSFALLEAMALRLPPVVSDAPGNPEAVGKAGIVVPRGDVAGFVQAYRRLAGDERVRARFGESARERVAASFRADEMVARTRELYENVLSCQLA